MRKLLQDGQALETYIEGTGSGQILAAAEVARLVLVCKAECEKKRIKTIGFWLEH